VGEMAEALDLSFQDAFESQTWTRGFADSIIKCVVHMRLARASQESVLKPPPPQVGPYGVFRRFFSSLSLT